MAAASVPKLYRSVIEDVINGVKDAFLDEGVDEQALLELKQTWEKKLMESKAIDTQDPAPIQTHSIPHQNSRASVHNTSNVGQAAGQTPASAITHQLTLAPGGIVQPTVLQYQTATSSGGVETVTLTVPQKLTITLPAQGAQQGMPTVMNSCVRQQYVQDRLRFEPSAAAPTALTLHPDVAATLLQGGVLNMTQAPLQGGRGQTGNIQFQQVKDQLAHPQYTVTMSQPATTTAHVTSQAQSNRIIQLDGAHDTSDEEEDEEDYQDNDDDRDDNDDEQQDDDNDDAGEEEEPLNTDDDVSDDESSEIFEIDNVVVCQYDKITRSRNRWKFQLKDGIMNLQGKDYVFQKAVGDAEW